MTNHPNRGRPTEASNPDPAAIRAARDKAGQTQTQAAAVIYGTLRGWQQWEAGERRMPPSVWELYLLKTDQHDQLVLAKKRVWL